MTVESSRWIQIAKENAKEMEVIFGLKFLLNWSRNDREESAFSRYKGPEAGMSLEDSRPDMDLVELEQREQERMWEAKQKEVAQ